MAAKILAYLDRVERDLAEPPARIRPGLRRR